MLTPAIIWQRFVWAQRRRARDVPDWSLESWLDWPRTPAEREQLAFIHRVLTDDPFTDEERAYFQRKGWHD